MGLDIKINLKNNNKTTTTTTRFDSAIKQFKQILKALLGVIVCCVYLLLSPVSEKKRK